MAETRHRAGVPVAPPAGVEGRRRPRAAPRGRARVCKASHSAGCGRPGQRIGPRPCACSCTRPPAGTTRAGTNRPSRSSTRRAMTCSHRKRRRATGRNSLCLRQHTRPGPAASRTRPPGGSVPEPHWDRRRRYVQMPTISLRPLLISRDGGAGGGFGRLRPRTPSAGLARRGRTRCPPANPRRVERGMAGQGL